MQYHFAIFATSAIFLLTGVLVRAQDNRGRERHSLQDWYR